MKRPLFRQLPKPPPPENPPACRGCGTANACFGLGPPLVGGPQWWCATCIQFQPAAQAALAEAARAAIEGED